MTSTTRCAAARGMLAGAGMPTTSSIEEKAVRARMLERIARDGLLLVQDGRLPSLVTELAKRLMTWVAFAEQRGVAVDGCSAVEAKQQLERRADQQAAAAKAPRPKLPWRR